MINTPTLFHFFWVFYHFTLPCNFATEKSINHYLSKLSMKILNFWMVALMALSLSTTFVSCSDNDDDTNLAKEIAGIYNGTLEISVMGTSSGSTNECKAVIKRASDTTVDITLSGFANLSGGGGNMSLGNFTITGVNVTTGANGTYSLNLGEYESTDSTDKVITGESLSGTITADGTVTINTDFKPGSMPMAITAVFTGSNTTSAE